MRAIFFSPPQFFPEYALVILYHIPLLTAGAENALIAVIASSAVLLAMTVVLWIPAFPINTGQAAGMAGIWNNQAYLSSR
jgi:hypothetical protein